MTISEQRRLAVARALATEPELLLMDEVMAGLNPSEVREMVDVVLRIRERGIACLIVEHVLEGIMPIADKIVVLERGRKIAEGTPARGAGRPGRDPRLPGRRLRCSALDQPARQLRRRARARTT